MIRLHLAIIVVSTSYLTLGAFDQPAAREYWLPYALVTLVLAAFGIIDGWKDRARA